VVSSFNAFNCHYGGTQHRRDANITQGYYHMLWHVDFLNATIHFILTNDYSA